MSDFTPWYQALSASFDEEDTTLIRDDGDEGTPAYEGERDKDGHLVCVEQIDAQSGEKRYVAVDPPRPEIPARAAWPEGVGVRVKRLPSTDDLETINRLEAKYREKDPEMFVQRVTVGVLIRELVGSVWAKDDEGNPAPPPAVPNTPEKRIEFAKGIPPNLLSFLYVAIVREVLSSPLPGLETETKPKRKAASKS